jgi:hypothetical protein
MLQGRYACLGDYAVAFETFKQDVDQQAHDLAAELTRSVSSQTREVAMPIRVLVDRLEPVDTQ